MYQTSRWHDVTDKYNTCMSTPTNQNQELHQAGNINGLFDSRSLFIDVVNINRWSLMCRNSLCICFIWLVTSQGDNVPKVLVFTTDGDFLMAWNTTTLEMPHGIFLADAGSLNPTLWITDVGNGPHGHCIKQYSPSGKLLQVTCLPVVVVIPPPG